MDRVLLLVERTSSGAGLRGRGGALMPFPRADACAMLGGGRLIVKYRQDPAPSLRRRSPATREADGACRWVWAPGSGSVTRSPGRKLAELRSGRGVPLRLIPGPTPCATRPVARSSFVNSPG